MAALAVGNGKVADAMNRRTINLTDLYVALDQRYAFKWAKAARQERGSTATNPYELSLAPSRWLSTG